jgi:hypothetical protein
MLHFHEVYGGLDELMGFRIPDPHNLEAGLFTSMLNPNNVARAHVSANAGQQSAASANTASDDFFGKALPSLVSAVYGHDKAVVFSRLTALFHTVQRIPLARSSWVAAVLAQVLC